MLRPFKTFIHVKCLDIIMLDKKSIIFNLGMFSYLSDLSSILLKLAEFNFVKKKCFSKSS